MLYSYDILVARTPEELTRRVREFIDLGWQPVGGLAQFAEVGGSVVGIDGDAAVDLGESAWMTLCQAMVLITDPPRQRWDGAT